ncbi:MAG TPA: glycine cleavage system protein GcvH [Candidatus Bathyarchaeia archaeon]|nr:glycine cleavage system protein GcvH [Candidatus Bathyarchaeia archaeon]
MLSKSKVCWLSSLKGEFAVPEDLYYTKEHEWLRIEGGKCRVGVTDYAQNSLHEIVYVDLPKLGAKVELMQSIGTVESVKAVADVYSPVSGTVLEVNNTLSDAPELVNKNPYGQGWITIIVPEDLNKELLSLMKAHDYKDLLKKITEKK